MTPGPFISMVRVEDTRMLRQDLNPKKALRRLLKAVETLKFEISEITDSGSFEEPWKSPELKEKIAEIEVSIKYAHIVLGEIEIDEKS
jgi:hypothetical protein